MILDHYTVHTRDLDEAKRFYTEVLGLAEGYRPPFDGPPGAWLYGPDEKPVVHLYAGRAKQTPDDGALDHIAFVVDEIEPIVERLERNGVPYETAIVPEQGARQVFFRDPDGVQIELNYEPTGAEQ